MTRALLQQALDAHKALREWARAVPKDAVLPAMPGIDGDWLDAVEEALRAELAKPAQPERGQIVVTKNEAGQIVAVTRQDEDGKILEVIATSMQQERQPMTVYQMMEYVPQGNADAGTVSGIVAAVEAFHGIKGQK